MGASVIAQLLILVSTAAFIIVGGLVGVRLLLLARRTRQVPDWTVGLALFSIAGVAYPLVLLCRVPDLFSAGAHALVFGSAMIVAAVGYSAVFVFTRQVFRPRARWALAFAGLGTLTFMLQAGGSLVVAMGIPEPELYPELTRDWTLLRRAAAAVAFGWSGFESWIYHGRMQKRAAIGLADPLVANRFLLWAIASAGAALSTGVNAVLMMGDARALESPISLGVIAVAGLASAISLYLAFLPPRWLVRRLSTERGVAIG